MLTTSAIFTWDTAPADAFAAAPPSGAARRDLAHDAVGARGVDASQDRADVVRILDAVEHDDERRPGRPGHEIGDADRCGFRQVRGDALVHAAARRAIELGGCHTPHRHAVRARRP